MGKLVFWALLAVAAWFAWQAWQRAERARLAREAREADRRAAEAQQVEGPEAMVRCAHCGIHLPRSEAVGDGSRLFCGPAHRAAARGGAPGDDDPA